MFAESFSLEKPRLKKKTELNHYCLLLKLVVVRTICIEKCDKNAKIFMNESQNYFFAAKI